MKEKVIQYKNLILVTLAVILVIAMIAVDPLGFCAQRAHDRAAIHNQMAIEKAEAEKQIAIIKAQTDAELRRIEGSGDEESEAEVVECTSAIKDAGEITDSEINTPEPVDTEEAE